MESKLGLQNREGLEYVRGYMRSIETKIVLHLRGFKICYRWISIDKHSQYIKPYRNDTNSQLFDIKNFNFTFFMEKKSHLLIHKS